MSVEATTKDETSKIHEYINHTAQSDSVVRECLRQGLTPACKIIIIVIKGLVTCMGGLTHMTAVGLSGPVVGCREDWPHLQGSTSVS